MTYKNVNLPFNISATATAPYTANINFKSQDGGSAKLTFTIFKDNVVLPLADVNGKLVIATADGSKFIDAVIIEDATNGVMSYVLSAAELSHPGAAKAELLLYYTDNTSLSVHQFNFTIYQSLIDTNIVPFAEFYFDDLETFKESVNATVQPLITDVNTLQTNITSLQQVYDTLNISTLQADVAANTNQIGILLDNISDIAIQVPAPTGEDDTDLIQACLNLGQQQNRTVQLKPNKIYIVYRKGTKAIRDTINSYTYGYSLIIPNGVTFDLNGSTIKLANSQDSLVLMNEHPDATSDATLCTDQNINVRNGIIDQNNTNQASTYWQAGIYFAKVQNGSLKNIKVINARMDGFRVMGCRNCEFDKLYAKNVQGHGFYIGRNDPSGYDLRLYDCAFGLISGESCVSGYFFPVPSDGTQTDGNSIHFMAVNSTVDTMIDKNTSLGIKIAGGTTVGGSEELVISKILANGSPVKFQHTPKRVQVGSIGVVNSPSWAVAIIDPENIQIGKINCFNCNTLDESNGQVLWCEGKSISIEDIILDSCFSSTSILFQTNADKYNIKSIRMTNCKGAIEIPANGSIVIGDISIIKDLGMAALCRGINVSNASVKLRINSLIISGNFQYGDYFLTSSKNVKIQSITKEGVNESGRTITLAASASTTISGSSLQYIYKTYGSIAFLPIIRFISMSSASRSITIYGYKINPTTFDLTIYHSTATGTEQFILSITEYTGSDVQFS